MVFAKKVIKNKSHKPPRVKANSLQSSDLFEMAVQNFPTVYFDGGCSPNPGKMSCGIVVCLPGQPSRAYEISDLGQGTNNIAEWAGLIWATEWARANKWHRCEIIGDSKLAINQAKGSWKINNQMLMDLFKEFKKLSRGMDLQFRHVLRDSNLAGIYLEHGRF